MVEKIFSYRYLLFFLSLIFLFGGLKGEEVSVDAQIDQSGTLIENQPLKGLISIAHNEQEKVDETSFRLGDSTLDVDFVREVRISPSSPLVLSYYQFALNGQPKGLQVLPSVSVKVGSHRYQSPPTTSSRPSGCHAGALLGQPRKSFLKLEAFLQGPAEIYPGTRFKVVYRYIFNDNIELLKEELPLMAGTGFIKIGTQKGGRQSRRRDFYSYDFASFGSGQTRQLQIRSR